MSSTNSPILPAELELKIFKIAARENDFRSSALQIVRVCRRANHWIKPLLFECIYLDYSDQATALCAALLKLTPSFVASAVKTVFILSTAPDRLMVLGKCTGLTSLASNVMIPYSVLADLRPRRLSLAANYILNPPKTTSNPDGSSSIFGLPFFSQVTHLELHALPPSHEPADLLLLHLPHLTHLALNTYNLNRWDYVTLEFIADTLAAERSKLDAFLVIIDHRGRARAREALEELKIVVGEDVSGDGVPRRSKSENDLEKNKDHSQEGKVAFCARRRMVDDWELQLRGGNIWARRECTVF